MKRQAGDASGFTLIELLVVIFIISIVTSVAVLSISRNENKRLASFTNEFVQVVTLAEEQAMLQPTVLGLSLSENSFHFSTYRPVVDKKTNPWLPLQDRLLGQRDIPNDIQLGVVMGGVRVSEESRAKTPQIIISTNGDITPFTIYVGKRGHQPRFAIHGDADGHITSNELS